MCLREAILGAVEVREVGGIDSVGQHGRLCGQQLPVPSTCALHIMYVTMEPAYECTVWIVWTLLFMGLNISVSWICSHPLMFR